MLSVGATLTISPTAPLLFLSPKTFFSLSLQATLWAMASLRKVKINKLSWTLTIPTTNLLCILLQQLLAQEAQLLHIRLGIVKQGAGNDRKLN